MNSKFIWVVNAMGLAMLVAASIQLARPEMWGICVLGGFLLTLWCGGIQIENKKIEEVQEQRRKEQALMYAKQQQQSSAAS